MRIQDIVAMLRDNVTIATILAVVIIVSYSFIYRKLLRGQKQFSNQQKIVIFSFSIYVITVLALTLFNRGPNFLGGTNLSFFSSYKEAWYNFSVRDFQYIYFNILMFVPLGVFLPFLHNRFKHLGWLLLTAFLFTVLIETIQFLTSVGIFEFDDLFNNVLGAWIGYGILKAIQSHKSLLKTLIYLIPLFFVLILSGAMFSFYYIKDYGNLSIAPSTNVDMSDVTIKTAVLFGYEQKTAPIYRAPSLSKEAGEQFAYNLFSQFNIDTTNIEMISYQNEVNYRYNGDPSYFIWLHLLNGTYSWTDFSSHNEDIQQINADESTLQNELKRFGIFIPTEASFNQIAVGQYEWIADQIKKGNQLIDGRLIVSYYNDGTVKNIEQKIVHYEKVKDVSLISANDAYQILKEGQFKPFFNVESIQQIEIKKVRISYELDSKGFYQPVYEFQCLIDGQENVILIPALN